MSVRVATRRLRFRGSTGRFSSCYGQDATQEDIYDNDVKPLLDVLYHGVVSGYSRFVPFDGTLISEPPKQDCDDLCVWRHLFREDPYNARDSDPTGDHPSCYACV